MKHLFRRMCFLSMAGVLLLPTQFSNHPASAAEIAGLADTAGSVDSASPQSSIVKQLNSPQNAPLSNRKSRHPKDSLLNDSQDRVIKKSSFKVGTESILEQVGSAARSGKTGFFVLVPPQKLADESFISHILEGHRVSGLSVLIPWSTLQPQADRENWRSLDDILSLCHKYGKTAIVRISTAGVDAPDAAAGGAIQTISDTPDWVFKSGAKSLTYVDGSGAKHVMPIFWDKNYLAKWANFVADLGQRYDNNSDIHSIGITGGGCNGGVSMLPAFKVGVADGKEKSGYVDLEKTLKTDYGMNQRQLVEHWKYVSDLFPKYFKHARLNFAINPPVPHRYGEDALDEISDYLVYRYGARIYLTRQDVRDAKHGFDEYRTLLKFRNDTITGIQLADGLKEEDIPKISKHALDDGCSFVELPASIIGSPAAATKTALQSLSEHLGYRLVIEKVTVPEKLAVGESLPASFSFINLGAATAIRPERNFDKDTAASYRVEIELRNADGIAVLRNVHTPPTPTTMWMSGQTIAWRQDLKMIDSEKRQLPPGEYSAWMSLVDSNAKRKINFIDATSGRPPASVDTIEVGKIVIVAGSQTAKKLEAGSVLNKSQGDR